MMPVADKSWLEFNLYIDSFSYYNATCNRDACPEAADCNQLWTSGLDKQPSFRFHLVSKILSTFLLRGCNRSSFLKVSMPSWRNFIDLTVNCYFTCDGFAWGIYGMRIKLRGGTLFVLWSRCGCDVKGPADKLWRLLSRASRVTRDSCADKHIISLIAAANIARSAVVVAAVRGRAADSCRNVMMPR